MCVYLYLSNVSSTMLYRNLIRIAADCNTRGSFSSNLEKTMVNIIHRVIVNLTQHHCVLHTLNSCKILHIHVHDCTEKLHGLICLLHGNRIK